MLRVNARELNRKLKKHPVPTAAILELTSRCRLHCVHCIRDASPAGELSTEEWIVVLEDLRAVDAFSVCFTGGEALLHEGFSRLAARARRLGMAVTLKTSGVPLEAAAHELAAIGIGSIDVSLYGASAEIHDSVTRAPGSFDASMRGIRRARAAGIPVHISFMIMAMNAGEIGRMRALADELGCTIQRDFFLMATDCGRDLRELFIAPGEIRNVEAAWPMYSVPQNQNGAEGLKICAQGMNTVAVTATGDVLSCTLLRKPLGNVRRISLKSLWEALRRDPGSAHAVDYRRMRRCGDCIFLPQCYICIGQNHTATGTLYEPPLERCYVTMALYGREKLEERANAGIS